MIPGPICLHYFPELRRGCDAVLFTDLPYSFFALSLLVPKRLVVFRVGEPAEMKVAVLLFVAAMAGCSVSWYAKTPDHLVNPVCLAHCSDAKTDINASAPVTTGAISSSTSRQIGK